MIDATRIRSGRSDGERARCSGGGPLAGAASTASASRSFQRSWIAAVMALAA
jgi:hypothetical protein